MKPKAGPAADEDILIQTCLGPFLFRDMGWNKYMLFRYCGKAENMKLMRLHLHLLQEDKSQVTRKWAIPKSKRPRMNNSLTGSDHKPEAVKPFHSEAVIWHLILLQSSRAEVDTSLSSHRRTRALFPSIVLLIPSLCELLNHPGCEQL